MCKHTPRKAAVKSDALTEALWFPLNSVHKFHFVFTSSGLVKSGSVTTLVVQNSLVVSCVSVHQCYGRFEGKAKPKYLSLETFS